VEYLIAYEGSAFAFAGNVEEDVLNITAVRAMREEAVKNLLHEAKADWSVIDRLIAQRKLVETEYKYKKFTMKKFGDIS
jgi:hypothetical protein